MVTALRDKQVNVIWRKLQSSIDRQQRPFELTTVSLRRGQNVGDPRERQFNLGLSDLRQLGRGLVIAAKIFNLRQDA